MFRVAGGKACLKRHLISPSVTCFGPLGSIQRAQNVFPSMASLAGTPCLSNVGVRGLAGHSKWANIKHKKARNDAAKEKQNTQMARSIAAAVAHGGGPELDSNFLLNSLVTRAKKAGVPNAVIDRAIDRGAGKGGSGPLEKHVYEGSKGIALFIVEVLTDSKTRAVAEVRHAFRKYGGAVSANSARFAFETLGSMEVDVPEDKTEEEVALDALEHDLDSDYFDELDIESEAAPPKRQSIVLFSKPTELQTKVQAMKDMGYNVYNEELIEYAKQKVEVIDDETAETLHNLIQTLEDLDDVTKIYHNIS